MSVDERYQAVTANVWRARVEREQPPEPVLPERDR